MSGLSLSFAPFLPWPALAALAIVAAIIAIAGLLARLRGSVVRALALALFVLALANPSFSREERDTLPNVVAVVVDKSASQGMGDRTAQTETARAALADRLKGLKDTQIRFVDAGANGTDNDGTALFGALSNALADVPPDRVGGAILLTDGVVHDIPAKAAALGFNAPVHALVTGRPDERDRRIALIEAPRFGIVGKSQAIRFRVIDQGPNMPPTATVVVRRDGQEIERQTVAVGEVTTVAIEIGHGGANIVEVEASSVPGELTEINNKAVLGIEGIRDKMRVLLVSGEPHAGERTWRNLLKADANVELVHFTILRPPQKQDGTPINELSLIAFPTRTLFAEKISDFDLIIFDRYAQEGILPQMYYDNITEYVRNGGAVLLASGPDYASESSLWGTSLSDILPAEPTGSVIEEPFRPKITDLGRRHPVTRDLPGGGSDPPAWSEWFRTIETNQRGGTAIMSGARGDPLLVLAREQKGRVALLLSDHEWLWARGFQGGGPHVDLLRRLSHWLMQEPDLEEEALRASVRGHDITVERQTMADGVSPVTVTSPSGKVATLRLDQVEPGLWRATLSADEMGLWRVTDGTLTALASVGPANPREFQEVVSTTDRLKGLADQTGASARRLADASGAATVPRVAAISGDGPYFGEGWIGLKQANVSVVRGVSVLPLFAGLMGLALLLGALAAVWAREGR
jgi:hypothetical protein